jgi:molecular chaperone Hsp33
MESNKLDVGGAVGKDGFLTVIKDFGFGQPYNAKCRLVSGEIAEDLAYYFTVSEQLPSAVALGVLMEGGKCKAAGGVLIQVLPNCTEEWIVVFEDIARNFANISSLIAEKTPAEIIEENFGHFNIKHLPPVTPQFFCGCKDDKIKTVIKMLKREEIEEIITNNGFIEINCNFCGKNYRFDNIEEINK